jgi:hypothetical protein
MTDLKSSLPIGVGERGKLKFRKIISPTRAVFPLPLSTCSHFLKDLVISNQTFRRETSKIPCPIEPLKPGASASRAPNWQSQQLGSPYLHVINLHNAVLAVNCPIADRRKREHPIPHGQMFVAESTTSLAADT